MTRCSPCHMGTYKLKQDTSTHLRMVVIQNTDNTKCHCGARGTLIHDGQERRTFLQLQDP